MMNFIEKVNRTIVKPGTVEIFWLGQAGFLLKTEDGKQIAIDPYFSDCVFRLNPEAGYGFKRIMPPVCSPKEMDIDVLIITHEHNDHFDVDAIWDLVKPKTQVYTNKIVAGAMKDMGFENEKIHLLEKEISIEIGGVQMIPLDCDHGELSPEALGLILDFGFIKIYYAGDTAWNPERLKIPVSMKPEAAILPINGAYGNMDAKQAAVYAGKLECKICIPCHFWTFPIHYGNPQQLIDTIDEAAPGCRLVLLAQGEAVTL